jgi:hypothetical protein
MAAQQIAMYMKETKREAEAVPPKVHACDIGDYRINVVHVAASHVSCPYANSSDCASACSLST